MNADQLPALLITGASSGIGRSVALRLRPAGYRVFAIVRSEAAARSLASEDPAITPLVVDLRQRTAIVVAAQRLAELLGGRGLAGLINCAGVSAIAPLEHFPADQVIEQVEVNLLAPFWLTQAVLPQLRRTRGRVINIGSLSGRIASPFIAPYAMTKFGLAGLNDCLRLELAPLGVTVSLVEPGPVKTRMLQELRKYYELNEAQLPLDARERYAPAMAGLVASLEQQQRAALEPERIAALIQRILVAPKPNARYHVGANSRLAVLMAALLPRRWMEALILRMLRPAPANVRLPSEGTSPSSGGEPR